ncbi:MAG: hypothetical protein FJ290_11520 [Planctomycetes bacterium]|nr:hypothetical protein [Planctomycetota bacterium]
MTRRPLAVWGIALGLAAASSGPSLALGQGDDAAAKEIVQAAGVKAGLAFHLGCGRTEAPGLTAAFAEQGLVVHGLALDNAAADRARKAIEAKGLAGRAMVEHLKVNTLPYLNDLANLVVVEDAAALLAAGIARVEMLRVLAPGGALCVLEGGKWTKTVKPRPKEMDDWTHPLHGPDGNMVSNDKVFRFPFGFRWIDGVPMNLVRWAGVRGWVVAGGRCYTLSSTQLENLGLREKPHYLVARDAWNGLPLWKINCETTDDGSYLTWVNAGPLVADDTRVYAVKRDKLIAVDGATGQIVYTLPNKYAPNRILLADGLVVTACWEGRDFSLAPWDSFNKPPEPKAKEGEKQKDAGKDKEKDKEKEKPKPQPSLWSTWIAKGGVGTLEAYEAASGKPKWTLPIAAEMIVAADGVLYGTVQTGNPPTDRDLVAVGLQDGKERWRVACSKFGPEADFQLNNAGPGYVVVCRRKANSVLVFSAKDGKLLWQTGGGNWTPLVNGLLWVGGKKHDPLTGEVKGNLAHGIGGQGCTPSTIVNDILTQSRGCAYVQLPPDNDPAKGKAEGAKYTGARGGCMEGMVPANGMFYTAQNNCGCSPGHVYGFLAMGPSGEWPNAADSGSSRPVEKGPAFNAVEEASPAVTDWPLFLHDAERSSGSAVKLPEEGLKEAWKVAAASPGEGLLGATWRSRLEAPLSAPAVAYGLVLAAKTDAGQIVAYDAATGKPAWTYSAGSRIDTPPTLHRGLAVFGCHDGYVYALRAKDGVLAWRTRIAPWERRMVAYGIVESVWPAVGTVLVHEGVLIANAGRTSESDGGIAVAALDPATGSVLWGKAVSPGPLRQNDLLRVADGKLLWQHVPIDPKTGAPDLKAPVPKGASQGGLLDGTWTRLGKRRAGNAFACGDVRADLLAWNDALIVSPSAATPRGPQKPASDLDEKAPPPKGWKVALGDGYRVEAMALAGNAAIFAGRVKGAAPDKPSGFLWIASATDGKKLAEFLLSAPPTFAGIAVAADRIFVSLQDGSLVSFAK